MSKFFILLRSLVVLYKYRHRMIEGVIQDVRQQYVGSLLGSLWAVLLPLFQLSIYAILYAFIFKIRPNGLTEIGYILLVFSGLVPLMTFSSILVATTSSLSSNKTLLVNTVFPVELIPVRTAMSAQVTGMIGLIITLIIGFISGHTSWQAIILVPLFWIFLFMFSMGIGWMLSLFSLVIRDIQHGLGLIIMLLFLLSPFGYTPEMVPQVLKGIIYANPLSYFVMTFQQLICYGVWPDLVISGITIILSLGSFFVGFIVFQKSKHVFFDYV